MTGPDLDDDDALDDALRALGTPAAGRPTATATAFLASAPPAAPVGMGLSAGIVGAAVVAALGAGTLLGFGAAAALFVGLGAEEPAPVAVAGVPSLEIGGRDAHRYGDEVVGEESDERVAKGVAADAEKDVAVSILPTAARTERETAGKADRDDAPAAVGILPTVLDSNEEPAGQADSAVEPADGGGRDVHRYEAPEIAEAPAVAPKTTIAAPERLPRPQVVETRTPVRHEAQATWALGLRVTSGGPAWKGTIDGLAPELAGAIGFVAGGGPVRPRARADLALGVTDSRATAATSGMVGLAADLGPARFDFGGALGFRWIAARPGAETPFDDEAGWLVFGLGPSATLVVPRRGADVFFGAEALYSSLSFDGEVHRVPWLGVSAGIEIHGSKARRLYR